ncbi:hypothetical protein LINGRAHAP2_LOCUS29177 [Linum grandiflorum]
MELEWVRDMGYEGCVFETDCQGVALACQGPQDDITECGTLMARCREVFAGQSQFMILWIRRDRNRIAHELTCRFHNLVSTVLGMTPPNWCVNLFNDICLEVEEKVDVSKIEAQKAQKAQMKRL